MPLYIGKSENPFSRWVNGHLRRLREEHNGSQTGSYAALQKALKVNPEGLQLFCVNEDDILFPPIPGFPTTAGAVEYQLVGLAQDAFPGMLLNKEGAAR